MRASKAETIIKEQSGESTAIKSKRWMSLLKPTFVNGTFLNIPNKHPPDRCQWEKFWHPAILQKSRWLSWKTDFKLQSSGSSKILFRHKSNYFLSDTVHISSNTHLVNYAVKSYVLKIYVKSRQISPSSNIYESFSHTRLREWNSKALKQPFTKGKISILKVKELKSNVHWNAEE